MAHQCWSGFSKPPERSRNPQQAYGPNTRPYRLLIPPVGHVESVTEGNGAISSLLQPKHSCHLSFSSVNHYAIYNCFGSEPSCSSKVFDKSRIWSSPFYAFLDIRVSKWRKCDVWNIYIYIWMIREINTNFTTINQKRKQQLGNENDMWGYVVLVRNEASGHAGPQGSGRIVKDIPNLCSR
jgi:hypothetical protein